MNNLRTKRIFITGGHITPAIAVIDELKKTYPDWKIILIGRNTLEEHVASEKNIRFLPSSAGRLSSVFKVPVGFVQSLWYCSRQKPDIVVSFGGYVALPMAVAASLLGIPVITHEQTRVVGLANRIIGFLARKICVTFEEQIASFPKGKTVLTGLPMRRELFHPPKDSPFPVETKIPIIYITGGSTGAVSLNDIIFPLIKELVSRCTVVHQTGKPSFEKAMWLRDDLKQVQKDRYLVRDYFDGSAVSWILHHASLIVGRSGANTVMEAAVFGKTMLCIPLPWSGGGEQTENARWLVRRGLAQILPQKEADGTKMLAMIGVLVQKVQKEKNSAPPADLPHDGAHRMLVQMSDILDE